MTAPARPEDQADDRYRPCRTCSRCLAGTGRQPRPGDCWDEYLSRAVTEYLGRPQ